MCCLFDQACVNAYLTLNLQITYGNGQNDYFENELKFDGQK